MEKHSTVELRDISGPLKDFLDKLSGEDEEQWLRGFKRFLRKDENIWGIESANDLSIWKTLIVGTRKEILLPIFLEMIGREAIDVSWIFKDNDFLAKIATRSTDEEAEIDLVLASVRDLGFRFSLDRSVPFQNVYRGASVLGLQTCSPDIFLYLLENTGKSSHMDFYIYMDPIDDFIFYMNRLGGQYDDSSSKTSLYAISSRDLAFHKGSYDQKFLFVRPRKEK